MELAALINTVESLRVRIKEKAKKADVIAGVYHRPPSQDDNINKLFFKGIKRDLLFRSLCPYG